MSCVTCKRRTRRRRSMLGTTTTAAMASVALFRGGQFRSSSSSSAPHYSLVAAAATPISPAAAEVATTERRNNDGVIVHGRGRHESSRRRLRRLQNTTTTSPRVAVVVANVCKSSPTLHPGESISRGEFLCHGDLRFGIDARDGRFIVGFAANANAADVASTNATIAAAAAIDDGSAPSSSMFDGASDASSGVPVADAAPVIQAWAAIPTTLFTAASTSFSLLKLSAHGNLLGYSSSGAEIYDSNYDYYNRLAGKRDDSVLGFNPRCAEEGAVRAMASGGREMCVTLTSPARAGMPYGMVTWGVAVDVENFVEMYPVEPTPSPVVVASPPPTSRPNIGRPAARMPSASPSRGPAGTEDENNNLFLADASPQNNNDNVESPMAAAEVVANAEPASIIWGTVWIDSNRNGAIDQGESTANGFEVRLYECSSSENAARNTEEGEGEGGGGSNNFATKERVATTDGEGMYFFNVPAGRTYRIKFDLDNAAPSYSDDVGAAAQKNEGYDDHKFGYTHGEHTSANMLGWTDCETSSVLDPIQWNAGLYVVDDAAYGEGYAPTTTEAAAIDGTIAAAGALDDTVGQKSPAVAATSIAPVGASIGGHIYLDVDEDGSMDSKERTAAVGGYTVNDAVVVVSLADCRTNEVLATSDVMFPGTYEFGNLTEGLYRLGYRMQLRAGHGGAAVPSAAGREDRNAAAATITPSPPYSFVDGTADDDPTAYETGCGKLGKGEAIDSGNVGLRPARPLEITAYVAGGPLGPQGAASDGTDDANATVPDEARAADVEADDANEGGSGGSTVPVLVGVLVTLSVVAFAAALFVKQRNGEGGMFPFLGGSSKTDGEVVRSVGSVAGLDDDDDDASSVASAGDTGRTAIGSLVVEAGNMSVAALTNITGGKDDDDDDSDSDDSSSSSSDEENRSYTGMEFALQNRQQQQQQQQGTPNNNNLTMDHSSGGGGSPYQYSLGSDNNSPSHVREVAAREGGSEGYEVYDNVNEEEHGVGGNGDNAAVYGSVISNMIANYSQAQEGHGGGGDEDERRGLIEQGGDQGVQAQNYSDLQGRQEGRGDYHGSAVTAAHPQEHLHGYSEHQDQHANYGQDRTDNYPREQQSQNYYSIGNNAAAYDQVHQHQYAANGRAGELQYEEMSTTSGSSARSSDPPAASYRDIPAANSGWDGRGGHPHHPAEEHHEHHHQAGEHHHQYSASHQYVPGDGGAYAANYEGYDSNQYAAGNDGSYPANYDSNQYAAKEEGGAYAPNYDDYDEQHQPVDSDSSESLSELMSDDESESSEEASASGWSSSSETTGGASLASKNSWSYFPTSGGSKSLKAAARRAQSNPRDDRRLGGWRNEAAIPENSTVEYNAYAGPDGGRLGDLDGSGGGGGHGVHPNDNVGTGGYTPVQPQAQAAVACDDKSVVSAGSAGSEGSADPPGASYKKLSRRFPPPPRTSPPPRRTSPNPNASSSHNRVSPNTSPHARRTSPHTSPVFVRGPSPNNTATASRRGRSVPPPPPPRGYPSPPPR